LEYRNSQRKGRRIPNFVKKISIPMFKKHKLKEAYFLMCDSRTKVITIWENKADIVRMENSKSYKATVAKILSSGLIEGDQSVELFDIPIILFYD
jgi:hypothetical protein